LPKPSIRYTREFKTAVLGQLQKGHNIAAVADAFGLPTATIYRWKQELEESRAQQKSRRDAAHS